MIEPYRPDSGDLNIGVRSYPSVELSAIERPLRDESSAIYSYSQKYLHRDVEAGMQSAPREHPAKIPASMGNRIQQCARDVADLVQLRGISRVDFLFEDSEVWINEVNTIPGALALYLWAEPKIDYERLVLDMMDEAVSEPARFETEGADGTALREAGQIASKLA